MASIPAAILIVPFLNCIEALGSTTLDARVSRNVLLRTETTDLTEVAAIRNENAALKEEVAQLRRENQRLQRKAYLLEIRQNGCPLHGEMPGDGEDYNKRWACFPSFFQAKYCMANEETAWGNDITGDCSSNPYVNSSRQRYARWEWHPPKNPSKREPPPLPQLEKVGPPYVREQFTPGLYDIMRMNNLGVTYWDMTALNRLQSILASDGGDVSPTAYPKAHKDMQAALDGIGGVRDKTVLVLGSISPWLESIALFNGAKHVTTVDYNQPVLDPEVHTAEPRLRTRNMAELLESRDIFDVILSYSSIEHDGLGRYGDPLNPDGDLIAQREAFLMLHPEGKYILGTLGGQTDELWYVSARGYGPVRMPVLAQGWKFENAVEDGNLTKAFELHGYPHNVLILSKPRPAASTLEETYGEEGCALHCLPAKGTRKAYCFPRRQDGSIC